MDSLCLKMGIHGGLGVCSAAGAGGLDARTTPSHVSTVGRSTREKKLTSFSRFSFKYALRSLWPPNRGGGNNRYNGLAVEDPVLVENNSNVKNMDKGVEMEKGQSENWVLKILHVRSLWKEKSASLVNVQEEEDEAMAIDERVGSDGVDDGEDCDTCKVGYGDDEREDIQFDRDSFSRLLRRVSLVDAKLYAKMSFMGNLAYSIPKIKPMSLLKHHGLRFVTSSTEKKELAAKAEKNHLLVEALEGEKGKFEDKDHKNERYQISASAASQIATSAASCLHPPIKTILPLKSSNNVTGEHSPEGSGGSDDDANTIKSEVASFMATTDSVTTVVLAKEDEKQAVVNDLNSMRSSPCEWFICDDDQSGTRFFVIQGSESLASWQANLLFEPIQFEGLDVLVHRGIYELAKGIYQQMLPEVRAHLKSWGNKATFRFTGHSLGGSLALVVNLMLLLRHEVPILSLLPVITFGAPSVMCGGDRLLRKLGLPRNHVQAITMHKDIVPRAFSCNYPNHVAEILKRLLYAPIGELLILQPDEKFSPSHDLLPSGSGLYLLSSPLSNTIDAEKQLRAAQIVFLNSPHPLEILSDRSAYGSEGGIQRDHDMNSYMQTIRSVIYQDLSDIRKARREQHRKIWRPLVAPCGISTGIVVGRSMISINNGEDQSSFSGISQIERGRSMISINNDEDQSSFSSISQTKRESLKRFSRLVASQRMHLFVVLLFPTRLLFLGAYSMISFC
ncbi:phospholipase A1 PLIP2, chloroplastic-like isoform X2 [Juglans regia]|uniref:Phospholipase A1 PLIP2, chloroplastic-like isoform X2 n=1 Tax=Juglans regia TaxID=51240 RepID=A0A6P9EPW8_JUGRE|nr:phospholipase A1 PLIP2, chloroplastic-like isoform X2 [Juglans regia]